MKVFFIGVVAAPEHLLASEANLVSFGFFERTSAQEFMVFFAKTIAKRTAAGTRQSVTEKQYTGHTYHRADGLVGVALVDAEYPQRVAQALINKVLDDFSLRYPKNVWSQPLAAPAFPELKGHLDKFQDPSAADSLTRVQRDLDETKIILHDTMQKILDRGEKLDDLVAKSEDLSMGSKSFYKAARKTNSCCVIL